jgi:hypothetical protein
MKVFAIVSQRKAEKKALYHWKFRVGYWIFGNSKIATVFNAGDDISITRTS